MESHKEVMMSVAKALDNSVENLSVAESDPHLAQVVVCQRSPGEKERFFLLQLCELPNYHKLKDSNQKYFEYIRRPEVISGKEESSLGQKEKNS